MVAHSDGALPFTCATVLTPRATVDKALATAMTKASDLLLGLY